MNNWDELSDRELEIVKLVSKGLTNKEISKIANIQISTVFSHLTNICEKLEIKGETRRTILAIRYLTEYKKI